MKIGRFRRGCPHKAAEIAGRSDLLFKNNIELMNERI